MLRSVGGLWHLQPAIPSHTKPSLHVDLRHGSVSFSRSWQFLRISRNLPDYETLGFITTLTTARHLSLSRDWLIASTPHLTSSTSLLLLFFPPHIYLPCGSFLQVSPLTFSAYFSSPHMRLGYLNFLNHSFIHSSVICQTTRPQPVIIISNLSDDTSTASHHHQ